MQEYDSHQPRKNIGDTPRSIPYGALVFFIFAGLGVLGFGIFLTVQNIREPFQLKMGSTQYSAISSDLDSQDASKQALRFSDTDGDTLTDYDELYVYRTSPYLADTDSDGYADKEEIASGHDPNCPSERNCFAPTLYATSTDAGAGPGIAPGSFTDIFGGKSPQSIYDLGALSVDQIKKLLKSQGVTDEQLQGVDDKSLTELYQKTYSDFVQKYESPDSLAPFAQSARPRPTSIDESKLQNPETLTADEIRQLVRESGTVPIEQLNAVDDATLKELFLKSVKQAQQQQQQQQQ